jgi:hypothetical protein
MPAPTRPAPVRNEPTALAVPKGIVGYYTDVEVDSLLAGLEVGGGGPAPDLTAYATTAYVDGQLATVYTKAAVDALLAPITSDVAALTANQGQQPQTVDLDLITSQLQSLAAVTQGVMDKVETKADKATVSTLGATLMNSILEVKDGSYTKAETDAAILAAAAGDVDLSAYATTQSVEDTKTEIIAAVTPALAERYTKIEVDTLVAGKADQSEFAAFQGQFGTQEAEFREYFRLLNQGIGAANTSLLNVYTKPEVDAAIAGIVTGDLSQEQIDAIISQVGPVDLTAYAKSEDVYTKTAADERYFKQEDFTQPNVVAALAGQDVSVNGLETTYFTLGELVAGASGGRIITQQEGGPENTVAYLSDIAAPDLSNYVEKPVVALIQNQMQILFDSIYTREESDGRYAKTADPAQNIIANGIIAKGYAFGSEVSANAPGLVYTDTNQGYGERLILDLPAGTEYLVYASDLEAVKSRVEALEGKAAPAAGVDMASYLTVEDADAKYGTLRSVDLLRGQLQSVFDSIYTRAEADARYVQKSEMTAVWATKADVFGYVDAKTYTKPEVDAKLAAINPLSAPSINDPALADFKKSVLDEVKRMLAGGEKYPPPDIAWTRCLNDAGTKPSDSIEARMIGGWIEFRGTLATGSISGSKTILQLPPEFPLPELTASYPIAARLVGSNAVYTYSNFSSASRAVGVTMASAISEVTFSGLRVKAAY